MQLRPHDGNITQEELSNFVKVINDFDISKIKERKLSVELRNKEYAEAVKKGDKDKAELMVNESAKEAMPDTKVVDGEGNPIKVYHYGNKGINVFDREKARTTSDVQGMFFSDSQEDWSDYGDTKYAVYLDIKNPYIVDSYEKAKKVMPDLSKTGDGIRIREELQAEGYDGIINTKDYMGTEGNEYVVFDSNQIKSADPITYDDAGKLIPLSERFNMDKDDMRFSFDEEDEDSNEIQWSLNEKEKDETIKRIDKRIAELNRLSEDELLTISNSGNDPEFSKGGLPATKTGAYRGSSFGAKVHKKIGFAKLLVKNISGFIEKKTKLSPETFGKDLIKGITGNKANDFDSDYININSNGERLRIRLSNHSGNALSIIKKGGQIDYGHMDKKYGLKEAPIRLSLGEDRIGEDGRHHGYGLLHIEAQRGDEIRSMGYGSVEEFVEEVATNYNNVREGHKIGDKQTYLLEITDKRNNTLFVELSKDKSYWNVNSAGSFSSGYSRKKKALSLPTTIGSSSNTETAEVNHGHNKGVTVTSEDSSLAFFAGKSNKNIPNDQENLQKKSVI